uniref:Trafficking protein particle complex subunit 2-like protein n=1 Tax=Arcella intermedia TaxID=1963864 RepID=A0A6B2LQG9_9EUKA
MVAVAVVSRKNNPLYLKTFVKDNALKFHFIVHSSLDVIEEKVKKSEKQSYLGLLYPTEDYKVYGYITNTGVKMILVASETASPKDPDVKVFFQNFHKLFVNATSNPFYENNSKIESPSFDSAISQLASKPFS